MLGTIGRLNVLLGLASGEFVKGLDQAQAKLDAFSGWAKAKGRSLTTFITAPLVGAAGMAVKWASDTAEAVNAVTRTYGTSADEVIAWSETTARAHGIAQADALSTMAVLSSVGRAAGFTDSEMADFGQGLIGRAADLASFYNAAGGTNEVLGAMQAALRGEFDPLERFGIRINANAVEQKALEMGLVGANGELTDQAKILATNAIIMEQSDAVAGDFAMTSDGLANKSRILRARIKDLGASFGAILLPIVEKGVALFERLLGWFEKLSPATQKFVLIALGIAAALGPILLILGHLAGALSAIIAIAPAVGAAFSVMLGPIGLIVLALAALAVAYKTNLFGFRDAVNKVARKVAPLFGRIVDGIREFVDYARKIKAAFDVNGINGALALIAVQLDRVFGAGPTRVIVEFIQTVVRMGTAVKDAVLSAVRAFQDLRAQGLGVFDSLKGAIEAFFTGLHTGIGPLDAFIDYVGRSFSRVVDQWQNIINLIKALIAGDWAAAWEAAKDFFSTWFDGFVDAWSTIGGLILDAFRAIDWGAVGSALWAGFLAALDFLADVGVRAWNFIKDQFDAIDWGGLIGNAGDALWNMGSDLIGGLKRGIDDNWKNVVFFLANLGTTILFTVADLVGVLLDKGRDLIEGLRSGIDEKWQAIIAFLENLPGTISVLVPALIGTLLAKGKELIQGFHDGATDIWTRYVYPFLLNVANKALEAVPALIGTLLQDGKDLLQGLKNGIDEVWALVKFFLNNLATTIGVAVPALLSVLLQKGRDLMQGLRNGITDGWSSVSIWLQGVGSRAAGAVGGLGSALYGAGTSLMQGLRNGIEWGWNNLVAPFLNTISGLIPDFKGPKERDLKLLYQPGQWVMQGFMRGIQSQVPLLESGLASITDRVGGFGMATPGLVLAGASVGGQGTTTNTVTISVNGAGDPDAVADRVFHVLARELGLREGV